MAVCVVSACLNEVLLMMVLGILGEIFSFISESNTLCIVPSSFRCGFLRLLFCKIVDDDVDERFLPRPFAGQYWISVVGLDRRRRRIADGKQRNVGRQCIFGKITVRRAWTEKQYAVVVFVDVLRYQDRFVHDHFLHFDPLLRQRLRQVVHTLVTAEKIDFCDIGFLFAQLFLDVRSVFAAALDGIFSKKLDDGFFGYAARTENVPFRNGFQ